MSPTLRTMSSFNEAEAQAEVEAEAGADVEAEVAQGLQHLLDKSLQNLEALKADIYA